MVPARSAKSGDTRARLALVIQRVASLHLGLRAGLAMVLGVITALGFEPFAWWPLLLPGVAGLSLCVLGTGRWWQAVLLGYAYGLGFMGLGVNWMSAIFVEAMVGLVGFTALFYAGLGAFLYAIRQLSWWPLAAATAWTLAEAIYSRFPFGGFGWMRVGYALVDSPFAGLYPLVGVVGIGFAVCLVAQLLLWPAAGATRQQLIGAAATLMALLGLSSLGMAWPAGTPGETVDVGWVQGGAPGGGVYGLGTPRTLPRNHLAETTRLAERVTAGELPQPAFVIWPENSTDMDATTDAQTTALVEAALAQVGVPILVGTILDGPGQDERQTASLWWDPTQGILTSYVKRGIVPFGEWVPLRPILLPLIPNLAYVGAQSIAGNEPGVLDVDAAGQPLKLGVMICYDVSFDEISSDTVRYGGEILVVQSSNAMYQGTGQITQQFAITRARAAELRREILVVTTSGVSGLITADGSVDFQISHPQAASGVVQLPRRTGLTPALWVAPVIEAAAAAAALWLALAAGGRRLRRRAAASATLSRAEE